MPKVTVPGKIISMATTTKRATCAQNSLRNAVAAVETKLMDRIRALVEIESPSDDKGAVDRCVDAVVEMASELGGRVKRHRQRVFGDVLEVRFWFGGKGKRDVPPLLLLGHLDTVWPMGTLSGMPFRVAKGRAWGPGVLDMKAGGAMALTAVG